MLVTSQSGRLYMRSGNTTSSILDLSGKICSDFERGLLGVTVDPAFSSNSYIYLFYTYNKNNTCQDNSPNSPVNRVSRFVLSGSTVSGEVVLVDNMPSPNGNHNAGGLVFGKDGYLYISIGDGGCQIGDASKCAGQNGNARVKNRLQGKVLRVDRNGNAPTSNPFYSAGGECRVNGSTTSGLHCQETYGWGFRNPFRIAVDPNAASTRYLRQRRWSGSVGRDRPALGRQGLRLELLRRQSRDRQLERMPGVADRACLRILPRLLQLDYRRRVHSERLLAFRLRQHVLLRRLHLRHDLDA